MTIEMENVVVSVQRSQKPEANHCKVHVVNGCDK